MNEQQLRTALAIACFALAVMTFAALITGVSHGMWQGKYQQLCKFHPQECVE